VCADRADECAAFMRAFHDRYGRHANIHYPHALRAIPKFAEWLQEEVEAAANSTEKPLANEFEESKPPEQVATSYRAMYAHGMYFRIKSAEDDKVTCDSGVAAAIWRRNRGHRVNRPWELESREFVGWIEEILEVDYHNHCCIVLSTHGSQQI
jgi:hypothetical protein